MVVKDVRKQMDMHVHSRIILYPDGFQGYVWGIGLITQLYVDIRSVRKDLVDIYTLSGGDDVRGYRSSVRSLQLVPRQYRS